MNFDWQPPVLITERLILRPVAPEDAEGVFAACSNPKVAEQCLFSTHTSIADSELYATEYAANCYARMIPNPLAIQLKRDELGLQIGSIGCSWHDRAEAIMEFGYWLAEPCWGRGFMTEAAMTFIPYLFANFDVETIQACVFRNNPASRKVLDKLGFHYEGVRRNAVVKHHQRQDIHLYALTRTDMGE